MNTCIRNCNICNRADTCWAAHKTVYKCEDFNHPGIIFTSKNKAKLQKFSKLLSEEGSAMSHVTEIEENEKDTICDIDVAWSGCENINPFYFWYYGT